VLLKLEELQDEQIRKALDPAKAGNRNDRGRSRQKRSIC
jgi:hypothetical protein